MPRGIPNAKRDDLGMKYTTFHVPLLPNPKNSGSSYLKYESQTIWARNAARSNTSKSKLAEDLLPSVPEGRRGSKVIVIHPGSRWLRIGRASDVVPTFVPHVIARKHKPPVPPPIFVQNIARPETAKDGEDVTPAEGKKKDDSLDDPVERKISSIATSLRDRMRFYKLRVVANASRTAAAFNEHLEGETMADNDPVNIPWITEAPEDEVLVGEMAWRLSDPQKLGYTVKRPFYGGRFNTRDYPSHQNLLSDVEFIWRVAIKEHLGLDVISFKDYSVVLVVPDLWDRFYVQELVNLLMFRMRFKQIVCQQESLAATYGAGISNACVIDMGAAKTSVACVDDGLVIQDTRLSLNVGGDDITEFLYVLLNRISFPYKELDLAQSYDWLVMEDIKHRICTLSETDVALNLYDFIVRRPGKPAQKYGLRAYDEVILAPMIIFEPRVVEFDNKRIGSTQSGITDEIVEFIPDRLTNAMLISTQHLMPQPQATPEPLPPPTLPAPVRPSVPASGAATPHLQEDNSGPAPSEEKDVQQEADESKKTEDTMIADDTSKKSEAETIDVDVEIGEDKSTIAEVPPSTAPETQPGAVAQEAIVKEQSTAPQATGNTIAPPPPPAPLNTPFLGNLPIDVPFEASKLPLDVAIFNSARAAGGDDRIRKYLQAVLVVGGSALIPGMSHALESRLQAIATPLVPNMEKVQIIPPPKDVDPRILVWKGAAVLGKMEGVADLWLTSADWQLFGMRALKERCYYL